MVDGININIRFSKREVCKKKGKKDEIQGAWG
jgi:hypothetical protein